jgi:RNA-directed DNA polymerase
MIGCRGNLPQWCQLKQKKHLSSKRPAILTGISRKGCWRLSKTLATQTRMPNEWLEQQGLLSIRQLWMKVQGCA